MPPEAAGTAPDSLTPEALAQAVIDGDRGAIAHALNTIDDSRTEPRKRALALLDALARHADTRGGAIRVGITGAPGAGKSTLLDALVSALRRRERSVGIIAVDPSSQKSRGALLGDRVRLGAGARDSGVFLRSMAARDRLGGLADATPPSLEVLAAAYDVVFIETVGVGQSEGEVAQLVDTLVFVAQPGAGDLMQFMKAGILELPDIFLVNKSDVGKVAEQTASELRAGLDLGSGDGGGWKAPVLLGSARDHVGIDALVEAIDAHRRHLESTGQLAARRERGRLSLVRDALRRRYGSHGLAQLGDAEAIDTRILAPPIESAFRRIERLGGFIEERLRGRA